MSLALSVLGATGFLVFSWFAVDFVKDVRTSPDWQPATEHDYVILGIVVLGAINGLALMYAAARVTA